MGIYEASVETTFRADHALNLGGGKLEVSHEHDWAVTATFRSRNLLEQMAVVIDFELVIAALRKILEPLEDTDLNEMDFFAGGHSSTERVAEYLADRLMDELGAPGKTLYCVTVTEAPGCKAGFYPGKSQP